MYAVENSGIVLLATASSNEVRVWYAKSASDGEYINDPDSLMSTYIAGLGGVNAISHYHKRNAQHFAEVYSLYVSRMTKAC